MSNSSLLEPVGTIAIPALAERFSVREKYIPNYGLKAKPGVRIARLGHDFQAWFGDTVEEEATVEIVASYARLTRSSVDRGQILAALDNRPDLAMFPRQIYWLMERQPNGEPGTLLTNGWANIFYLPGLTRVVGVSWDDDDIHGGWVVLANSVTYLSGWFDGHRVFSSNSCAAVAA